jgi:hypothetical protein
LIFYQPAPGIFFLLGGNWSLTVTVKAGHTLIRGGPYAVARHPIYSGLSLAVLGTALTVGEFRGLVAVGLVVFGFRHKSLVEERFRPTCRGAVASPDDGDAPALTFAQPVVPAEVEEEDEEATTRAAATRGGCDDGTWRVGQHGPVYGTGPSAFGGPLALATGPYRMLSPCSGLPGTR